VNLGGKEIHSESFRFFQGKNQVPVRTDAAPLPQPRPAEPANARARQLRTGCAFAHTREPYLRIQSSSLFLRAIIEFTFDDGFVFDFPVIAVC
jgi:hypothetical protein